jgi:hypothetical protein
MKKAIPILSLALWWGALTSIGFIVVPLLFVHLESPQVAGRMAATLFNALGYIAWGCGALLLATRPSNKSAWLIGLALLASVLIHFVVSPHIVLKDDLRLWHTAGTALFAAEWLILSTLLIQQKN